MALDGEARLPAWLGGVQTKPPLRLGCVVWYNYTLQEKKIDMATLSMFFGLIVKMYKERDGRPGLFANWKLLGEEGTFFKIEPLH